MGVKGVRTHKRSISIRRIPFLRSFIGVAVIGTLWLAATRGDAAETDAAENDLRSNHLLHTRCLATLHAALLSEEFWPAMHAAEALTMAGDSLMVRRTLAPRLSTEPDDRRRCGLARELVRSGDRQKVAVLFAILAGNDTYAHMHAAESLFKVHECGDGTLLHAALVDESPLPLRLMAAAALAQCGNQRALHFIRQQLVEADPESTRLLTWILGRLGDDLDIPNLSKLARGSIDAETRSNAMAALAMRGDDSGRTALAADLESPSSNIRCYAAEIAGYCHALNLVDRLARLLDDPDLAVRVRSAQSLLLLSTKAPARATDVRFGRRASGVRIDHNYPNRAEVFVLKRRYRRCVRGQFLRHCHFKSVAMRT
jgi:sialidase-1